MDKQENMDATMLLTILKTTNLALAFALELAVLAALSYYGFVVGPNMPVKILLGIGLPVLAVVLWGAFGAPRAQWHLEGVWFVVLRIAFFGSAALALYAAGKPELGVALALLTVLNFTLIYIWKQ